MAYGTVKVDNVTFTYNAADASTTFSGLYASTTNNLTLSGTASANTFTGTTANFTNTNAQNISVTTLLSGLAITGGTAGFTTVTGTTVTGTTANFVTVSGTTVTGGTAGFTTVTGTTVTGTTANFVTLSGTTVTGNIGQFTSLTGATTTMTSGVFALGTEPLPSISFVSDPNTGIYSPGADQVAVATNGVARLQINSSGTLGLAGTAGNSISIDGTASANRFSVDSSSNIGIGIAAAAGTPINIASSTGPAIELGANNGAYFGAVYGTTYTASEHFFLNALAGYHYYEALVTGPNAVPENVFNDDAANLDFRIEGQANANLFFVDASADAVGIGTSSPDVGLHYRGDTPKLRIESSNTLDTTAGTEEIGRIEWEGFRNTNFNAAASIRARQDGTWSTNTTWHSPAALEFYTQNNTGVEVTTPRMIINSSGNVGIGTTSPGSTLDIVGTDVVQTPNGSSPLVVRRSAGVNINLLCSNTGDAGIVFGDTDNAQPGRIIYSHSTDALQLWTNSNERARIDSSGRLLVGTSSALSVFNYRQSGGNLGSLQAVTVGAGANTPTFANFAAATYAQQLSFVKSRGTTIGDYAIVADGDNLGSIYFFGADGVDVSTAGAAIISQVDGTPGANDMPGRLVFSTTADGASSPTERMRINSAGALGVGGANFGTTGQALISNGSSAVPTWQDLNTAVFGWDHDNDTYGLYLPGTSISTGLLSGTINIDVQSRMRRCVINDSGVVQYYLDADTSTNKAGDWLRIVETESLATAYTGAPAAEATNSLLRVGVPAWAAGTFTRGQRVTNGGYLWECVAASSTATPAAGAVASVLDGTDGQVVVEIPAFSVRYGFINGVHTREVRLGCNDGLIAQGFRPHPAFIKTDGTYKSAFYWGAYQAYSDGTNLASVSGQTNTRSLTRATFRTRAVLRGTGWHVQSYLELAAVQTLLVTEYRDYNSQKVLGNGSIEGATYGVATGLSNSRGNRSGNVYTGGGSSSDFMSYRGIENLYGRAWTWADGINVYDRVVYLTNNQSVFADNTSVGYSFYAQVPSGSASYQKELFPLADVFLPSVVTGASSTTYLADGFWTGTGWRVALVGGASDYGSLGGAFGLALGNASGITGVGVGARSAYAAN